MGPQHAESTSRRTAPASATMTLTSTDSSSQPEQASFINIPSSGVLRLRGAAQPDEAEQPERRVQWAEDVVNNEGMGKKKSKVCCIYHKPREIGESSDDSSSSSDDNSSDDDKGSNDDGGSGDLARGANDVRASHSCGHHHKGKPKKTSRTRSPNAYEKQPKPVPRKPMNL